MARQQILRDLFDAVNTGNLEETKELLNSYGLSDFPALSEGYDFLLNALQKEYTKIVELLLSNNCRVNREGPPRNETTALHIAVVARETKIVQMLVDRQAKINALDQYQATPLMNAIENNEIESEQDCSIVNCKLLMEIKKVYTKKRMEIIELLAKSGADVNAVDAYRRTPLQVAISYGDVDIMEILLNNHADPNAKDENNYTLLKRTTCCQHNGDPNITIEVFQSLLKHGADPNICDEDGQTALHSAVYFKNLEVVGLLIDKLADINARDSYNQTPLHHAAAKMTWTNDAEVPTAMVNLLLEHGADPNVYDKHGKTPLCKALAGLNKSKIFRNFDEHCRIVDIFLSHGADLNGTIVINGVRSHSPLQSAVASGCSAELIAYLISKGAVNPETDYESSPLYHAAKNGDEATVKILLDHGFTTDPEGSNGESVLQTAVRSGCAGVVERIFRSFYANNESYTRRVKMTLTSLLAERFFERLRSWFKDRAGKSTGITDDQYRNIVKNFLQDAYTYETDRNDSVGLSGVEHIMKYYCDMGDSTTEDNWREARIVMLLISNGIDIDFRDNRDKGTLCYAIKYNDVEITRLCLTGQTKVDNDGLNVAAAVGRREIVDILLKHDPSLDVNAVADRVTPLLCTAMSKKEFPFIDEPDLIVDDDAKDDIARLLVDRGADVNIRWDASWERESPLILAAQNNRVGLVKFLMRLNADPHGEDNGQPIHAAARNNQLEVVKLLLRYGVDIDVTNYHEETAFNIAYNEGHVETVEFLLDQGASMGELFEDLILEKSHYSSEVNEVLRRHALRIIGSNKRLSEGIQRQIDNVTSSERLEDFVKECREEAAKMRNEKIGDSNVCFYDIFEKGIDELTKYARNENIVRVWMTRDLARKFPMHYKWMNINFLKGQSRVTLVDSITKVFHFICGCEIMPELVVERISSYLDVEDMKRFIEADCNRHVGEKL